MSANLAFKIILKKGIFIVIKTLEFNFMRIHWLLFSVIEPKTIIICSMKNPFFDCGVFCIYIYICAIDSLTKKIN